MDGMEMVNELSAEEQYMEDCAKEVDSFTAAANEMLTKAYNYAVDNDLEAQNAAAKLAMAYCQMAALHQKNIELELIKMNTGLMGYTVNK